MTSLGYRHTPEAIERIGAAQRGKKKSPESIEKMKRTLAIPEVKARHRLSRLGRRSGMLGKHHSEEAKRKIAIASSNRIVKPETREKLRQNGLGRKHTPESIEKMKAIKSSLENVENLRYWNSNERSCHWKGDLVGYGALHDWVKKRLPKPEFCQICKKVPSRDLSNISGKYLRDLSDWWYLCHKCHMHYDRTNDIWYNNKLQKMVDDAVVRFYKL